MFFGFLKMASLFKKNDIPMVLAQGAVIGIAREGDLNCHDHDMDVYYNPLKHHKEEPYDLQSGKMREVMDELSKIPLKLETRPPGGMPGTVWEDAEYDVGTSGCLSVAVTDASDNFAMGLSRVRFHFQVRHPIIAQAPIIFLTLILILIPRLGLSNPIK